MRIWLITIGEPLPIDENNIRLHRSGILADMLAEKGHDVLWWTSTFDHFRKTQRFAKDTVVTLKDNYHLRLLHAPGYRKNVSLRRIWNHYLLGRKFKALAETEPAPEVILCSLPALELSAAAVEYGKTNGVPVVLDIRDLWPDVFLRAVPNWAGGLGRLALRPMFRMTRTACANAFAITGHVPGMVDWGLRCGNRQRTPYDKDFPFGYVVKNHDDQDTARTAEFWKEHGVTEQKDTPIICFFGTIGHQFDLDTVIQAARRIRQKRDVQFVICGIGDRLDYYRKSAKDCRNVVFPGWVNAPEIRMLMRMAGLALAPYLETEDFIVSIPNKVIEYLSGGLPILSSMSRGILHNLLTDHNCGMSYDGRAEKLEKIICRLCDSQERLDKMSVNASRLFEDRFTASKVYGEMIDHLQNIASDYAANDVEQDQGTNLGVIS